MPEPLDLDYEFPDKGHQDIWLRVKQAIDESQGNSIGVEDSYFLTDLLFSLLDGAFASIDDLTGRLAALETPPD